MVLKQLRQFHSTLRLLVSWLLFCLLTLPPVAWANPTGGEVAYGSATFDNNGNILTITNSNGTVINWQDFSIQSGELTRFIQSGADSTVLNRVLGNNLSAIYGTLSSNGQVVLINPNGIVIGAGGIVDTAGFVASTLSITNEQFQAGGTLKFMSQGETGTITNLGKISASHGDVILISKQVVNHGQISALKGTAGLYASDEVEIFLAESGENKGLVRLSKSTESRHPTATGIENTGTIEAARAELKATGNIYALAINNTGIIRATGTQTIDGVVHFSGRGGTVQSSGTIAAKKGNGDGGRVVIEGDRIGLIGAALIDVRGHNGGKVYLGGDYQGKNTEIYNAQRTVVGSGVRILANALEAGQGGRVIVWANGETFFLGAIEAKGGTVSGNGGFVEVSGKQNLYLRGTVNVLAANGEAGTILLDPQDITIQGTGSNDIEISDNQILFAEATGVDWTITASALNALTGNILLQATQDIFVNYAIALTTSGQSLTLSAGRDLQVNAAISTTDGDVTLEADTGTLTIGYAVNAGTGNVTLINNGMITGTGLITANVLNLSGSGEVGNGGQYLDTVASTVQLAKSSGDTFLTNGGDVNLIGSTNGNLTINVNTGGGITQTASLAVSGNFNFTAAGAVVLTNASNDFSTITNGLTLNSFADISITDGVGGLNIVGSGLSTPGAYIILNVSAGSLDLGTSNIYSAGGNIAITAYGITNAGATISADGGVIILDALGQDISIPGTDLLSSNGGTAITIKNAHNVELGFINASIGNVQLGGNGAGEEITGNITQIGSITANDLNLRFSGNVDLTSSSNNIGNLITVTQLAAGSVQINDHNLNLGVVTLQGGSSFTTTALSGDLNITDDITAGADTNLTFMAGDSISLAAGKTVSLGGVGGGSITFLADNSFELIGTFTSGAGSTIVGSATGEVTINAVDFLHDGTITAPTVRIAPTSSSGTVFLHDMTNNPGTFSLSQTEINNISTSQLIIGQSGGYDGATVVDAINFNYNVEFAGGEGITDINAPITATGYTVTLGNLPVNLNADITAATVFFTSDVAVSGGRTITGEVKFVSDLALTVTGDLTVTGGLEVLNVGGLSITYDGNLNVGGAVIIPGQLSVSNTGVQDLILDHAANQIGTLGDISGGSGNITINDSTGGIIIDGIIDSFGDTTIKTAGGDIEFATGDKYITATGVGKKIVLVTDGNLINNSAYGATALDVSGGAVWWVYVGNDTGNVLNGLTPDVQGVGAPYPLHPSNTSVNNLIIVPPIILPPVILPPRDNPPEPPVPEPEKPGPIVDPPNPDNLIKSPETLGKDILPPPPSDDPAAKDQSTDDDEEVKPGETVSVDADGNPVNSTPPPALQKSLSGEVKSTLSDALSEEENADQPAAETNVGSQSPGNDPAQDDASVPPGGSLSIGLDGQPSNAPLPTSLQNAVNTVVRGSLAGAL